MPSPDPKGITWDAPDPKGIVWDDDKPAPPKKDRSGVLADMVKSTMQGLEDSFAGTVGVPGDIAGLVGAGMKKLGIPTRDTSKPLQFENGNYVTVPGGDLGFGAAPDSAAVSNMIPGETYEPQTFPGEYARTAGQFLPFGLGGAKTIGKRIVGRVLAPSVGATTLGFAADPNTDPNLHAALKVGGAVAGGGAVGAVRAGRAALAESRSVTPEITAQQHLARLLESAGATPDTLTTNAIPGRGQLAAEALGPTGVSTLATLGRRPGVTGEALAGILSTRAASAPQRIMDDYATAAGIHPEAARGNIDALVEAGQARAAPLFKAALDGTVAARTPELEALMARPVIRRAMAKAAEDLRNGGEDPGAVGLHFDEAGNMTARVDPTSRAWDLTKKALGQSVERDAFGNRLPDSKSPGNFRIGRASAELTGALKDAIPGYDKALKESGDYLSLQSAFNAGQKHILSAGTTAAQVAEHIKGMTPAEIDAYRGGIANEIFNKAQNARLAPRILNTPAVQQKLEAALGAQKAQSFMEGVQQEIGLAKSGGRMMPGTGSITSDVLLNAGEQDRGAAALAGMHGLEAAGHALTGSPLSAARSTIQALRHFAPDLLRSGTMTPEVRNELGRSLMLPPEDLAAKLRAIQKPPQVRGSALARLLGETR